MIWGYPYFFDFHPWKFLGFFVFLVLGGDLFPYSLKNPKSLRIFQITEIPRDPRTLKICRDMFAHTWTNATYRNNQATYHPWKHPTQLNPDKTSGKKIGLSSIITRHRPKKKPTRNPRKMMEPPGGLKGGIWRFTGQLRTNRPVAHTKWWFIYGPSLKKIFQGAM